MNIAVCIKQVPAYSEGNMDEKTGLLMRSGMEAVSNVYDLAALEAALQIREQTPAKISVFTMGPGRAESVLREAYGYGADEGFLVSDPAFGGADVLATSYTLMQAIQAAGSFPLVLCGMQTTDGDTGLIGGALAEWMQRGHAAGVTKIESVTDKYIQYHYPSACDRIVERSGYPLVLTVERESFYPRMPSLKFKIAGKKKPVNKIGLADLEDCEKSHYGLMGSATKVKKIFPPVRTQQHQSLKLDGQEAAVYIKQILAGGSAAGEGLDE